MSAHPVLPPASPLLAALGAEAERLHPEVARYIAGPGDGIGVCEGLFEVAGSRLRALGLVARPFAGAELLVTGYGRAVPFRVVNRVGVGPDGRVALQAEREFRFRAGGQRLVDVLLAGPEPGTLQNLLGRARRVELLLRCEATEDGHLRLRSEAAWIRLGRLRLRLPAILGVRVEVEDGWDDATGRQTIDAHARNPLLGTVLEYRGSFGYRTEATSPQSIENLPIQS